MGKMSDLVAKNIFKLSMVIDGCYELVPTKVRTYLWFASADVNNSDDREVAPENWETSARLAENLLALLEFVGDH